MKKPFIIAVLLTATTAAHAGNSISFEIKGQKIHIEAPKDCSSLSCLKVSAPGLSDSGFDFKGSKSKHLDDDNNVAERADPPRRDADLARTRPVHGAAGQAAGGAPHDRDRRVHRLQLARGGAGASRRRPDHSLRR